MTDVVTFQASVDAYIASGEGEEGRDFKHWDGGLIELQRRRKGDNCILN